jgi:phosphoserine phosphatase
MPRPYRAVLIDLDGTLTRIPSFWQHLHESLAMWTGDAEEIQRRFQAGEIDYATFCRLDAEKWKGRRESEFRRIADAVPLRPGARELREFLRRSGIKFGVISTGLTLLADRVHRDLNLDFTIANRLVARHRILTGEVKINVEHGRKDAAVELFCNQFGIPAGHVIAVGDSEGDISMFRAAGFSVAFNPTGKEVARAASAVCVAEDLRNLRIHLPLGPAPGASIH